MLGPSNVTVEDLITLKLLKHKHSSFYLKVNQRTNKLFCHLIADAGVLLADLMKNNRNRVQQSSES